MMEYRSFTITNRRYSVPSPRIWTALRPRADNATFGDVIATASTAEALYRNVDAYLARQATRIILGMKAKAVTCEDWDSPIPQPMTLHRGRAYGMLMPALTNDQLSKAPLNAKASQSLVGARTI